jgi:hypothetical protein
MPIMPFWVRYLFCLNPIPEPEFSNFTDNFTMWGGYLIFNTQWFWVFGKFRIKEPLIMVFEKIQNFKISPGLGIWKKFRFKELSVLGSFKNSKNLRVSWKTWSFFSMAPGYQLCIGKKKKKANRYQGWLVCSKAHTRPSLLRNPQESWNYKAPQRVQSSVLLSVWGI